MHQLLRPVIIDVIIFIESLQMADELRLPVHADYAKTILAVNQVRDCVEGSTRVKSLKTVYLPHPSQGDKKSTEALLRYDAYLFEAEFDADTDETRRELLGKMRITDTESELAQKIEYLVNNIDSDGTTLNSAIESAVNNVLQVKTHILVSDYQGLSGADLQSISIEDARAANPRAVIKQYARENLVNWDFRRINGAMKLAWMALLETGTKFDPDSYIENPVHAYLILALDEEGDYYQQKIVYNGDGDKEESKKDYQLVNGKPLNFIPVEIASDEELQVGKLPRQLGFLSAISDKVIARYNVSAKYKECQRALLPTTYTKGWKVGDAGLFEELNNRKNIESGPNSVNALPNNVEVSVESTQNNMDDFHYYFEQSKKQVGEMGGKNGAQGSNMTATEADFVASAQNALLNTVADNIEEAFKRAIAYCAMFEGLVKPEDVNQYDDVIINMPREFSTPKLSVEEVKVLNELVMSGVRTREQVIRAMANGGWDYQSAEDTIADLENTGGNLVLPPVVE